MLKFKFIELSFDYIYLLVICRTYYFNPKFTHVKCIDARVGLELCVVVRVLV